MRNKKIKYVQEVISKLDLKHGVQMGQPVPLSEFTFTRQEFATILEQVFGAGELAGKESGRWEVQTALKQLLGIRESVL